MPGFQPTVPVPDPLCRGEAPLFGSGQPGRFGLGGDGLQIGDFVDVIFRSGGNIAGEALAELVQKIADLLDDEFCVVSVHCNYLSSFSLFYEHIII